MQLLKKKKGGNMFISRGSHLPGSGTLEILVGSMFCGKTTSLITLLNTERFADREVIVFNHTLDQERTGAQEIVTHDKMSLPCFSVSCAEEILPILNKERQKRDISAIGIDECQFFPIDISSEPQNGVSQNDLFGVVHTLVNEMKFRVICAGLDTDYRGMPWKTTAMLMGVADEVYKLRSVCQVCKRPGVRSKSIQGNADRISVGGKEQYIATCRNCFNA